MRLLALMAALALAACAPDPATGFDWWSDGGARSDAGSGGGSGGSGGGGGADGGGGSGGGGQLPDAGPVTATVFPRVGVATDSTFSLEGPGLILMGGGSDVDSAFGWMRGTLSTSTGRLGDVVVLRASGSNAYDAYIFGLAPFNSVQTILLPPPSTLADLQLAAGIVDKAEAVWFAGGDQSRYAAWTGSELMAAVQRVYTRGGVVGGTSAGLAMLGAFAYDARNGSVTSNEALKDPYNFYVTFTRGALAFSPLAGVITDSHFRPRDRFGRLTAFMARQIQDGAATSVLGIGVDEATAVLVDKTGRATLVRQSGNGNAYFVSGGAAAQCAASLPLIYPSLSVVRLDASNQFYDLGKRCGTGPKYALSVDGRQGDPFGGVDPYAATASGGTCP